MYKEYIIGSIAHVTMLGEEKIIPKEDSKKIASGLYEILDKLNQWVLKINNSSEDIHSFIESTLTDHIGEGEKKLHTGRSRNDQVTLDSKLYLKGYVKILICEILNLEKTLLNLSSENKETIMPQKKNPNVAELVRGKTGRVYGYLMTLLTVMKGLPLAYNKDMQEDKEALFDGLDTTLLSIKTFNGMIKTMRINKDIMKTSAYSGFTNATDVADYLVKKVVAFRDAN